MKIMEVLQIKWKTSSGTPYEDMTYIGWGNDGNKYKGKYMNGLNDSIVRLCNSKGCEAEIKGDVFDRCTECLDIASGHSGDGNF